MCLAVPGLLTAVEDEGGIRMGSVRFGGVSRRVCLEAVPEARVGDYLLVHVGFALAKIDEAEAQRIFKLLEDLPLLSEVEA